MKIEVIAQRQGRARVPRADFGPGKRTRKAEVRSHVSMKRPAHMRPSGHGGRLQDSISGDSDSGTEKLSLRSFMVWFWLIEDVQS